MEALVDTRLLWVSMEEPSGGGADLINALPEDLLLQVLLRLRCAAAAARTSLLSRRWLGLLTRLPDLVFHDVTVPSIQAALSSLQQGSLAVSLLDIRFHRREQGATRVSSLLHAAAGLSPKVFSFAVPYSMCCNGKDIRLPCYHRATSIKLHTKSSLVGLTLPRATAGGFRALKRLTLSGFSLDLAALVLLCPCLRILRVSDAFLYHGINFRSDSLQELFVRTDMRPTACINVQAPMLRQLALCFTAPAAGADLRVSVVAPVVDKVSLDCSYTWIRTTAAFRPWCLDKVSLYSTQSLRRQPGEDTRLQLSSVYVLSLRISSRHWFDAELNLAQQIEKHLLTDFSVLKLTMVYDYGTRHVFGPFVLHLLGMHPIRTATRRLQILLRSKVKEECPVNCPCDEPKNWRSKNVALLNLEDLEIKGFEGEDHDFDFLKVIFRCAPMLKRMTVRMMYDVTTSNDRCMKIYDIFKAYPFVECKLV